MTEGPIVAINSCGTANAHEAEWYISMTAPNGVTGVEIRKCTACMLGMLQSPAVQTMGRTVHLIRITS